MVIPPPPLLKNSFSTVPSARRDHRRALGRHDVDRVVAPRRRPRLGDRCRSAGPGFTPGTGMARPGGPTIEPLGEATGGACAGLTVTMSPAADDRRPASAWDGSYRTRSRRCWSRPPSEDAVTAIFSMRSYAWNIAVKPGFIIRDSRITSQLVMPDAAVAFGLADSLRLVGAVDAVMLLVEVEPGDARPGRWAPAEASAPPCRLRRPRTGRADN